MYKKIVCFGSVLFLLLIANYSTIVGAAENGKNIDAVNVVWTAPPPTRMLVYENYEVSWRITGAAKVADTHVRYGSYPDPRVYYRYETASQSDGSGTYSATIRIDTTDTYYFVVYADADGGVYFSTVVQSQGVVVDWGFIKLVPSEYTGTTKYVPGETLHILVHGTASTTYNLKVKLGDTKLLNTTCTTDSKGNVEVAYKLADDAPDGPTADGHNYKVCLYTSDERMLLDSEEFQVKLFEFTLLETSYNAYIINDVVSVQYSVNNVKDSTPARSGLYGKWYVRDGRDVVQHEGSFRESIGSFTFQLRATAQPGRYTVEVYYNETDGRSPAHWSERTCVFIIGNLKGSLSTDRHEYKSEEFVHVTVKSTVDGDEPLEGCTATVVVSKRVDTTYEIIDKYGMSNLQTDIHGIAEYVFKLDEVTETTTLKLNATITKHGVYEYAETSIVVKPEVLMISVQFDKYVYITGETITLNVYVVKGTGTITYVYRVRDGSATGNLLAQTTSPKGLFEFVIPSSFEGTLYFEIIAYDTYGNTARAVQYVSVVYGIIVINTDKQIYKIGETVSVTYSLISQHLENPATYYTIKDADGNAVLTGTAKKGSFSFVIPSTPTEYYTVSMKASEKGVVIESGDVRIYVVIYKLSISVLTKSERLSNTYKPGDNLTIGYKIIPVGAENKQRTFTIYYGIIGFEWDRVETTSLEGNLTYKIPTDITDGKHLIAVETTYIIDGMRGSVGDYCAIDIQKDVTSLDTAMATRELFDAVLLILIIIAFIFIIVLAVLQKRALPKIPKPPKPPKKPKHEKGLAPAPAPAPAPPLQPPLQPIPPPSAQIPPQEIEIVRLPPVWQQPPPQRPVYPTPPGKSFDLEEEFAKLEALHKKGLITEEEMRESKRRLAAEAMKK